MGIIQYSALAQVFADWFVAISTPRTYPVLAYWYSGILNYFVPSGGSEWIITAPYLLEAARRPGIHITRREVASAAGVTETSIRNFVKHFECELGVKPVKRTGRVRTNTNNTYLPGFNATSNLHSDHVLPTLDLKRT